LAIVLSVVADREGCRVRTDWEPDELIGAWTLVEGDWKLIANKTGVTRLGSWLRRGRSAGKEESAAGGGLGVCARRHGLSPGQRSTSCAGRMWPPVQMIVTVRSRTI
jgi:hypothetical protein